MGSVKFDGSDDRIVISDNDFDGLSTGTVEFWFKRGPVSSGEKIVFKNGCIDIGMTGSGSLFGEIGGVGNLSVFEDNVDDNAWHHVAITWDGVTLRSYYDGDYQNMVASVTSQNNNGNSLYLGRRDTSEPFGGYIDCFRISNIARYTGVGSFTVPTEEFTTDANTLVLLLMNDGSGTTASDETGNNDGTLENGTLWSSETPFESAAIDTTRKSNIINIVGSLL